MFAICPAMNVKAIKAIDMQSFRMILNRFTRTVYVMDLTKTVIDERREMCERHERRYKTVGKRSVFKIED